MAFRVDVAIRARRDLAEIYQTIEADFSEKALEWFNELQRSMSGLDLFPLRTGPALEGGGLRQLLYGNKPYIYRVIFHVSADTETVTILHIRHAARAPAALPLA